MKRPPLDVKARHLAKVVESSDDAIVSKTLDGTITSWNRAAEEMFGYSAEEAVGRSIRMIVPADRQGEEDTVLARRDDPPAQGWHAHLEAAGAEVETISAPLLALKHIEKVRPQVLVVDIGMPKIGSTCAARRAGR